MEAKRPWIVERRSSAALLPAVVQKPREEIKTGERLFRILDHLDSQSAAPLEPSAMLVEGAGIGIGRSIAGWSVAQIGELEIGQRVNFPWLEYVGAWALGMRTGDGAQ